MNKISKIAEIIETSARERRRREEEERKTMIIYQASGWIAIAWGALLFLLLTDEWSWGGFFVALGLLTLGLGLLFYRRNTINIRNRYVMIVNQGGSNMSIDRIAELYPTSFENAAKNLQSMIEMGYFKGAYIDYANRMLVLDKEEYKSNVVSASEQISRTLEEVKPIKTFNSVLDAKSQIIHGKFELLKQDKSRAGECERIGRLYIERMDTILEKLSVSGADPEMTTKVEKLMDLINDMLDAKESSFNEGKRLDLETDIEALYKKLLADGASGEVTISVD